jgi:hypothetical protein
MYPSAGAGTSKASTAFWVVDDVAAEVAGLKARGVTFEEYDMPGIKTVNSIASGGGAKTAWFKDTEGTSWRSATTADDRRPTLFRSSTLVRPSPVAKGRPISVP